MTTQLSHSCGKRAALALTLMACAMAATAQTATAEDAAPSPAAASRADRSAEPPIADGRATSRWVSAQGKREQASKVRQTLSGPVMSKVHERYVNSFAVPVPEHIRDDTKVSGSK